MFASTQIIMKNAKEDTEIKMVNETPVYVDEAVVFQPEKEETAYLQAQLEAERERYLRLAAEYENYRRRTKKELAEAAERGKRELLERLISFADDFEIALANIVDAPDEKMVEGLRHIESRLKAVFEANDVAGFDSEGEKFNPEWHEAFDVIDSAEDESGTVHRELRRGYLWRGKLLRPALVIVAQ